MVNTKTLSTRALSVIDQYLHFRAGNAVCSVPYFNNRTVKARAALRADNGKGSPKEILDEVQAIAIKSHASLNALTDQSLKMLLVDNNIGIDCSGFAYYVLNAESEENKKGSLDKHVSFVNCNGILGRIRCSLRPIENCDVATLADDRNSRTVALKEIRPGDMIFMMGGPDNNDRDHMLVIHQIEYQNFVPTEIHYSHVMAYPEDGIYGSGVKQGVIQVLKPEAGLLDQKWMDNNILLRAQRSKTDIKRLRWL